jgi:hypothetical protein
MRKKIVISIILTVLLTCGYVYASLYAEYSSCDSMVGKVLRVVNDEVFTISVCEDVKVFREFSFCYNVEPGDTVIFDGKTDRCEVVGFTVVRNEVQCGVLCQ